MATTGADETAESAVSYGADARADSSRYDQWLAEGRELERRKLRELAARRGRAARRLRTSVLVRTDVTTVPWLGRLVRSIRAQLDRDVEVILCGVNAGEEEAMVAAGELDRHPFRHVEVPGHGPEALNRGLEVARGDLVTVVDADDVLHPAALAEVAEVLESHEDTDVVYTDEDRVDGDGRRSEPCFKPDWSPDLLLSHMYLGRLLAVRRSLLESVGGFRVEAGDACLHDLALRVTERAGRIRHVAKILCHRRAPAGLVEGERVGSERARRETMAILGDALRRKDSGGTVESGRLAGSFRVRRCVDESILVSVVVPFRDGSELLARCVRSLEETCTDVRWELLLVDNGSWEPETRALCRRLGARPHVRLLDDPRPFNWSAINNRAAREARGDRLLLLNDDVEARHEGWMTALLEAVEDPGVGAAGARLLYPEGRVQHAGIALGLADVAGHVFRGCPRDEPGYFGGALTLRNRSAVTGACMMVRRDVFEELRGFDETLPLAYNDVDFCLRLWERGHRVVWTPFAELIHHESATRGVSLDLPESPEHLARWRPWIEEDPFLNPNLSRRRMELALPEPGEVTHGKRFSRSSTSGREHPPRVGGRSRA